MTDIVKHINEHIDDNDDHVCILATLYLKSSYTYSKMGPDNVEISIQPGWPDKFVDKYFVYSDTSMAYNHKTQRMVLTFDDNTQTEISLYKFKRFAKRVLKQETV